MHFWGLTIDTVTTIILVLAVGLSVDYASHVAHTFMILPGTRYRKSWSAVISNPDLFLFSFKQSEIWARGSVWFVFKSRVISLRSIGKVLFTVLALQFLIQLQKYQI